MHGNEIVNIHTQIAYIHKPSTYSYVFNKHILEK